MCIRDRTLGETTLAYAFEACGERVELDGVQTVYEEKLEPVLPLSLIHI